MTALALISRGALKIRKVYWTPTAHLALNKLPNGFHGPLATLVDPPSEAALGISPDDRQKVILAALDGSDWEEFSDPAPDPKEGK